MTRISLSLATLVATATTVWAHPADHAMPAVQSILHLLTEPDHLAMLAIAAAAAVFLVRRRKLQK
jgi:hypothetical protein